MTFRTAIASLVTLFLIGCSDIPEIDQYLTFNVARSASFTVPPTENSSSASVTSSVANDIGDFDKQGVDAHNLRTAKITRVQLTSSTFNFNALSSARVLIGSDTVADSLYLFNGQYLLRARNIDIAQSLQDPSFNASLEYNTQSAITDSATLTVQFTIAITALPR
jgi:hypothetical protein